MSKVVLCRVCLRTDVVVRDIPDILIELHDEICNYDIYENKLLKYCAICEHLLLKLYAFRKQCNLANKLLKKWQQKKLTIPPENLHEKLLVPSLSICNNKSRYKIYDFLDNTDFNEPDLSLIKTETDEDKATYTFITKETQGTESVERIDIEEILQKDEVLDNFDELQKDNFDNLQKDNYDELQKDNFDQLQNDLKEDINSIQEDDLPLSNFKEENDCLDFLDLFDKDKIKTKVKLKNKSKVKKAKSLTEVKYEKVDIISLAELMEECGENDKLVKARQKFLKNKARLKERILDILDTGQFNDLGDNIKMTKEIFIKIFNRYDKCDVRMLTIKPDSPELPAKLRKFLLYLLRKYNPEYETVFDVEYLDTDEKKIQEFNRRREGRLYKEAPFKCELCYKGFDSQSFLEYHNKWHKPTPNDIVCSICPMRFVSKPTYKSHHKNNHSVVYSCRLCPVVTYHSSVMINHYNQHKGVEYHCPTCLSVYTNKTTLNNHRREAHATSHVCSSCARSFVSEKGLFFHKKYKHKDETEANPEEATLCTECNITFDSHAIYLRHAKITHARRPETVYKCYFCKDGFDSIEALRKHKLELNHQRAPKQVIHRTSIATTGGVKRTRRTRVSDPNKPYRKCPVCLVEVPNTFPTSLYLHYQEAHPDVTYNSLYTDSKDYLCEQCGKTFRVYCHYLDHRNQHTGAKPYACKQCPASFATRKHLAYHAERHRPPRYQCKQCGKMFLSAANLFAHRRGHIGDRRFKCDICFKGFLHSYTLREHINGVHNQIRRVRKLPPRDKNII